MIKPILVDLPERFETEHLILQAPKAGYGAALLDAISDGYEDYVKWLSWTPTLPTLEAVEEDCRRHYAQFILREEIRYLMIEKSSQTVVGRCALPSWQAIWAVPQFGIAYFVRRECRGQGYAKEASHALALLAFRRLSAKRVEIQVDEQNIASIKVPEALNFMLERRQTGWTKEINPDAKLLIYVATSEEQFPKIECAI
ncbi:MAG: GNAT family N-acetyltransferase [Pseudomonadota bacterium]